MPPDQRYKLTLAYRGTNYHGWQFQLPNYLYKGPTPKPGRGIPTIQETAARAIAHVVGHPVTLVGSSRTDSGVHAKGQVAHFDSMRTQIPLENMRRAINHQLPDDILIRSIEAVPRTFNAVLSPVRKRYQYSIWHAEDRPAFTGDLCWHRWRPMNIDSIRAAAKHFVGERDFTSFARPGHGRAGTVRTIYSLDVNYREPRLIFGIEGNGFLWHMVRIIVGTLAAIGLGHFSADDIPKMLAARDRRAAGPTAPPHGLYLHWIRLREESLASPLNAATELEELSDATVE